MCGNTMRVPWLTDGGGVSGREGVGAESHEEGGLAHVRVPHHQNLEDVVGLRGKVLNELQRLCVGERTT